MPIIDPEIIVLLTLVGSLVLFVTDSLRYDSIAVLVVLVLAVTGCLDAEDAFGGFASPAVVLVASMYVFAAAVSRNGITELLCDKLFGGRSSSEAMLAFRVVLVSGLLSSVLSNAAVVATLIPVLGTVAYRNGLPVSRLLIPLSFGSLLGGMLTLIGTSKNIAVNGVIEDLGAAPFGLFDFSLYGLALLAIGSVYFLGPGRMLLPRTRVGETLSEHYQVQRYVTEIVVVPESELVGQGIAEASFEERFGVTALGLVRDEDEVTILVPGSYERIRARDVLILQGEPEAIVRMREAYHLEARSAQAGEAHLEAADLEMVEAVVPANSSLVHRTLEAADFRAVTGLNVLAVSKHGDVHPTDSERTRLDVGDTLLLQGHHDDIERQHQRRTLIVIDEHKSARFGRRALIVLALLAGVLAVAALTSIHISVAALGGAVGLVFTRCIRPSQVRREMDWSVLILIGGMLALGKAFKVHGLDTRVADWMMEMGDAATNQYLVIGLMLVTTMALTQVINHVAAAVIMTPVALSLAERLGMNDRALLMAVLTGAEFAFMSPVAHQANAMVMGPGDYRYRDFLRTGTPLTLVLGTAAVLLIPFFWPS